MAFQQEAGEKPQLGKDRKAAANAKKSKPRASLRAGNAKGFAACGFEAVIFFKLAYYMEVD